MCRDEFLDGARGIVSPVLANLGLELVEIGLVVSHGRRTLRVFIDKPGGVNVSDCANASRAMSAILDEGDLLKGRYFLEVSSPGAERPLRSREDFERFIGRRARLKVRSEEKGIEVMVGTIESLDKDILGFKLENGTQITVPFGEIAKGNLSL